MIARSRPTPERSNAARSTTEVIERHSAALLAYFARRVDDPTDAADLLSDLLTVVWRRAADLPADETEARMWLYGAARRVLSTQRRAVRRRTALHERLRAELNHQHNTGPGEQTEAVLDVRAAIATLDPIDQEIIRLVHWEGFTQVEVATLLELPEGTVRSRHLRARTRLRGLITTASA